MRPRLVLLALLVTAALGLPATPGAADDPLPPDLNQRSYSVTFSDAGTNITIVLETNVTFLGYAAPLPTQTVLLYPKELYLRACYTCPEQRVPLFTPRLVEHCFIGTNPNYEHRVCLWDRENGPSLELGEVEDAGVTVLIMGDGCVIHQRDGLPAQTVTFEGLALPPAKLGTGGSCADLAN